VSAPSGRVERLREAIAAPLRDWESQEHVVQQQVSSVLAAIVEELGFTSKDVDLLHSEVSMLIGDISEEEDAHWRALAVRIDTLLTAGQ
jgi:hypothetical protein